MHLLNVATNSTSPFPAPPPPSPNQLASIFRRLPIDLTRLKIVTVPNANTLELASSGTALLPFAHLYLVLPESLVLNYALSRFRLRPDQADPQQPPYDIAPNRHDRLLSPAERYALAHEAAHLHREDALKQAALTLATIASVLALGPWLWLRCRWPRSVAIWTSMTAVTPAVLGLAAYSRHIELQADLTAGRAGYAEGGLGFWAVQLQEAAASWMPGRAGAWLATHPTSAERCEAFRRIVVEGGRVS